MKRYSYKIKTKWRSKEVIDTGIVLGLTKNDAIDSLNDLYGESNYKIVYLKENK